MAGVKGKSGRKPNPIKRKPYGISLDPGDSAYVDKVAARKVWSAAKVIERLIKVGREAGGVK